MRIYLPSPFLFFLLSLLMMACTIKESIIQTESVSKIEIRKGESGYQLIVDNEPFYIKGAGIEYGSIAKLAEHGGNSFRTWRINNGQRSGREILDEAHKYGLKVMMGIDVKKERHGFDYNNKVAVSDQLNEIKQQVMELKDHPALMAWDIGNELNLSATNPKVWDAVNDISKMIHEIDSNHLTTTSIAGINRVLVSDLQQHAPDLDFLCIQLYAEIENLPNLISSSGLQSPYAITEWGATGHWEIGQTEWGAAVENNSTVKAELYRKRYETAIESQKQQCIGSYVFLWGQKQERTPTWYGLFLEDGTETEAVDVMHYLWKGSWPANRSPRIESFTLSGNVAFDHIKLDAGKIYSAELIVSDPENDSITYRWEIMSESQARQEGGDAEEIPDVHPNLIKQPMASRINFVAPGHEGPFRLFVYAYDGHDHAAHANIPFYVTSSFEK